MVSKVQSTCLRLGNRQKWIDFLDEGREDQRCEVVPVQSKDAGCGVRDIMSTLDNYLHREAGPLVRPRQRVATWSVVGSREAPLMTIPPLVTRTKRTVDVLKERREMSVRSLRVARKMRWPASRTSSVAEALVRTVVIVDVRLALGDRSRQGVPIHGIS